MNIRAEIREAIRNTLQLTIAEAVATALHSDEVKFLISDSINDLVVDEVKEFIKHPLEEANNSKPEPAQLALVDTTPESDGTPWANATDDVAVEASEDFLKSVGL